MSICSLGLSCDPICDHGIHTSRQRCIYCELQKQITALTDMYKSLSIQVAAHHEHKLRQIDENRKISRRVDELEELNKQCFDANPIKSINERFEKLESKFADFMQKSSLNSQKVPFKCPVCDGCRKELFHLPSGGYYEHDCKTCEGKGIIWG